MVTNAIPHPDNGRRCICGQPIYLTTTGWRDRWGHGHHRQPAPRHVTSQA